MDTTPKAGLSPWVLLQIHPTVQQRSEIIQLLGGFVGTLFGISWKPECQAGRKPVHRLDVSAPLPSLEPGQGQPPAEGKFSCCAASFHSSVEKGEVLMGEGDFLVHQRAFCYHLCCSHQVVLMWSQKIKYLHLSVFNFLGPVCGNWYR